MDLTGYDPMKPMHSPDAAISAAVVQPNRRASSSISVVHESVGGSTVAAEIEELHHAVVGIDAVEEVAVALLPVAQDQPSPS